MTADDCSRNSATVTVTPFWLEGFNVRAVVLSCELEISLSIRRPSSESEISVIEFVLRAICWNQLLMCY